MEEDHNETEGEEGKSGDEGEVKAEMESNGQNMSGFHFLTEEEAETTDITDVSCCGYKFQGEVTKSCLTITHANEIFPLLYAKSNILL